MFFINDKKLSSHMAQISEHINSSNHNIHYYDQMGKMIINLGNIKCKNNNNNSKFHINHVQKYLLMSIVDTPGKYVPYIDSKLDRRKVRSYYINSSSELFSCSIRAIYNRVHRTQNQYLMLKSYIPAINKSIFPKKYYENIF